MSLIRKLEQSEYCRVRLETARKLVVVLGVATSALVSEPDERRHGHRPGRHAYQQRLVRTVPVAACGSCRGRVAKGAALSAPRPDKWLKNPEPGMMGYDTLQLSNYEKL